MREISWFDSVSRLLAGVMTVLVADATKFPSLSLRVDFIIVILEDCLTTFDDISAVV